MAHAQLKQKQLGRREGYTWLFKRNCFDVQDRLQPVTGYEPTRVWLTERFSSDAEKTGASLLPFTVRGRPRVVTSKWGAWTLVSIQYLPFTMRRISCSIKLSMRYLQITVTVLKLHMFPWSLLRSSTRVYRPGCDACYTYRRPPTIAWVVSYWGVLGMIAF